jgi:hypothetical protein
VSLRGWPPLISLAADAADVDADVTRRCRYIDAFAAAACLIVHHQKTAMAILI